MPMSIESSQETISASIADTLESPLLKKTKKKRRKVKTISHAAMKKRK